MLITSECYPGFNLFADLLYINEDVDYVERGSQVNIVNIIIHIVKNTCSVHTVIMHVKLKLI